MSKASQIGLVLPIFLHYWKTSTGNKGGLIFGDEPVPIFQSVSTIATIT
jgi:hypothetical protein